MERSRTARVSADEAEAGALGGNSAEAELPAIQIYLAISQRDNVGGWGAVIQDDGSEIERKGAFQSERQFLTELKACRDILDHLEPRHIAIIGAQSMPEPCSISDIMTSMQRGLARPASIHHPEDYMTWLTNNTSDLLPEGHTSKLFVDATIELFVAGRRHLSVDYKKVPKTKPAEQLKRRAKKLASGARKEFEGRLAQASNDD